MRKSAAIINILKIKYSKISSDSININQSNHESASAEESKSDRYDEMDLYKQIIDERICYDALMLDFEDPDCRYPGTAEKLTEIRDIMLECVCSGKKTIRVRGEDIPQERVRAVMLGLNSNHIMYVMECMEENNTEIKSIRSYLITALYNAPSTMSNYYASQASHMLSLKKEDSCKFSDYSGIKPLF